MTETTRTDPLVDYLRSLKTREDRGALAALRTGLGKRPGQAPRMFPHLLKFLKTSDAEKPSVIAAFLTASLYAKHPEHVPGRSLGLALWHATKREENSNGVHGESGVEARFTAMVDADDEDLPRQLEGLISLCESARVPLDWYRFHRDLLALLSDREEARDRVRMKWAKDFWQGEPKGATSDPLEGQEQ